MSNFWSYIIRRAWQSLTILLGVSIVVFGLMHLSGDPIRLLAPIDTTAEELEALRKLHGLDRPLPVQYWSVCRQPENWRLPPSPFLSSSHFHSVSWQQSSATPGLIGQ